jgi:hypothetical protein
MKSLTFQIGAVVIALAATFAYGADNNASDSALRISGWAFVHPVLPKPMKEGTAYKISFAAQEKDSDSLVVTVEFVNEKPKDNERAVLTVIDKASIRQGSFAVIDGKFDVLDSYVTKREKGRIRFVIANRVGTKILFAGPLEPTDVKNDLRVLSNILELK